MLIYEVWNEEDFSSTITSVVDCATSVYKMINEVKHKKSTALKQ